MFFISFFVFLDSLFLDITNVDHLVNSLNKTELKIGAKTENQVRRPGRLEAISTESSGMNSITNNNLT